MCKVFVGAVIGIVSWVLRKLLETRCGCSVLLQAIVGCQVKQAIVVTLCFTGITMEHHAHSFGMAVVAETRTDMKLRLYVRKFVLEVALLLWLNVAKLKT